RFDAVTDHVVHAATFVAVSLHVHRTRADIPLAVPLMLLLVGVALSMASVVWIIDRDPPERRVGLIRVYERIASRDYVYIVLVLTALGRLGLAGDAINYLTPSATIAGEYARVAMLGDRLGADIRAASVVVAKSAQTLAQAVFIAAGLFLLGARFVIAGPGRSLVFWWLGL